MQGPTNAWHVGLIEQLKQEIRTVLQQKEFRLPYLLHRIGELDSRDDPESRLERFLTIIYAFIEHERWGGLSPEQIQNLADLADSILKAQNVKAKTSQLAHLHGDLHLILSQIYRKQGRFWHSTWEQQIAFHLSKAAAGTRAGISDLATGNRVLRLGQTALALRKFEQALEEDLPEKDKWKARINRVHCLRLMTRHDEALAAITTYADDSPPASAVLDLQWEQICIEASQKSHLGEMTAKVRRGKPHFISSYILEAHLWTKTALKREWENRLPTVRHLSRDKNLGLGTDRLWRDSVLAIERAYDSDVPLEKRLKDTGKILARAGELITIDKELLMWAAAARWLSRSKAFELAAVALGQYESISILVSRGASTDVLHIVGDLFNKSWYSGGKKSKTEKAAC